jgi:ABC-type dipeptide/oligopeptide/nickel transport system ATPase subunit
MSNCGDRRGSIVTLLAARQLSAFYGPKQVLRNVSIEVAEHECLAVVGEPGSGKSTLARCLVGLHTAYSGELTFCGMPLPAGIHRRDDDAARAIQFIFQNPHSSLNPRRTIGQIMSLPCASSPGRAALITGASRGIGLAIAARLASAGVGVCITARGSGGVANAVGELRETGEAIGVAGKADDPAHQAAAVAATMERFGRLDYLVNNAGTSPHFGSLIEAQLSAVTKTFAVKRCRAARVGAAGVVRVDERAWRCGTQHCVHRRHPASTLYRRLQREQGSTDPHDAAACAGTRSSCPGQCPWPQDW